MNTISRWGGILATLVADATASLAPNHGFVAGNVTGLEDRLMNIQSVLPTAAFPPAPAFRQRIGSWSNEPTLIVSPSQRTRVSKKEHKIGNSADEAFGPRQMRVDKDRAGSSCRPSVT